MSPARRNQDINTLLGIRSLNETGDKEKEVWQRAAPWRQCGGRSRIHHPGGSEKDPEPDL